MPIRDGVIKPLRRTGTIDAGHVRYWFGRRCDGGSLVTAGLPIVGRATVHREIADAMIGWLHDVQKAGEEHLVDLDDYGGTYNCRATRGSRTPSPHSWGIAIDLNVHHLCNNSGKEYRAARWNFHCEPYEVPGSCRRLARYANRWGFAWGGHFSRPYLDPMHYEATELTLQILRDGGPTGDRLGAARLVVALPGYENTAEPLFIDGTHYISVRDAARLMGWELIDRRAKDGKLYLRKEGEDDGAQ